MDNLISYTVSRIYEGRGGLYCDLESCADGSIHTLLLSISDLYDAHLKVGDRVSDECFERLYRLSGETLAVQKAQRVLSCGDHSKRALTAKLVKAGTEKQFADRAALIMEEKGYIDEDSQTERIAAALCLRKGWGKRRIISALLEKGYEKASVMRAADLIGDGEYEAALCAVIERKYPDPPEDKREYDKRIASLSRLGFSLTQIMRATQRLWQK